MPSRLIVNADDFGLTLGVNRAVEELFAAGALTSATLMANGPAFWDAPGAIGRCPGLGVGCHVVLVDGVPVSEPKDIPSLIGPDGRSFRASLGSFMRAAMRGRLRAEDVECEAAAQVRKLRDAGVVVTHLDTHKHTHLFPAVAGPLVRVAEGLGIGAVRNPFEPAWSRRLGHGSRLRRGTFEVLRRLFEGQFLESVKASGGRVVTTHGTAAISTTGALDSRTLAEILKAIPDSGTWELVVHPGYRDAALDSVATKLRASREVELRALLERVPEFSRSPGAPKFIHYGELGPSD